MDSVNVKDRVKLKSARRKVLKIEEPHTSEDFRDLQLFPKLLKSYKIPKRKDSSTNVESNTKPMDDRLEFPLNSKIALPTTSEDSSKSDSTQKWNPNKKSLNSSIPPSDNKFSKLPKSPIKKYPKKNKSVANAILEVEGSRVLDKISKRVLTKKIQKSSNGMSNNKLSSKAIPMCVKNELIKNAGNSKYSNCVSISNQVNKSGEVCNSEFVQTGDFSSTGVNDESMEWQPLVRFLFF